MVDITGLEDVHEGDLVTLVGKDGDEEISMDELADLTGTISYELVCDVGRRVSQSLYKRQSAGGNFCVPEQDCAPGINMILGPNRHVFHTCMKKHVYLTRKKYEKAPFFCESRGPDQCTFDNCILLYEYTCD